MPPFRAGIYDAQRSLTPHTPTTGLNIRLMIRMRIIPRLFYIRFTQAFLSSSLQVVYSRYGVRRPGIEVASTVRRYLDIDFFLMIIVYEIIHFGAFVADNVHYPHKFISRLCFNFINPKPLRRLWCQLSNTETAVLDQGRLQSGRGV
jgi:hypothetical protein